MQKQELTKRQQQAQKTRQHIYDIGLMLMQKNGYHATTVSQISKAANVSVGAFYHHFRSKEDILSQIYENADEYFLQEVKARIQAYKVPEQVVEFFQYYADYNVRVGIDTMKVLYHADNIWFLKKNRGMQQVLQSLLAEGQARNEVISGQTAEEISDFLFMSARGVVFNWCMLDGRNDLVRDMKAYMQRLVTLFLP
ncbi:HTH-type transcriptional regulator AcrR [Vibrio aerogenes CECT 7868]|uniref:HTH-type transcriptional regulator AcrR n=1 Tax=Vibrio aerogenes CECT 7868 TaxID=1216006 RepID=A0A1M6CTZ3_9VIBR|nr:TetR/AcrR family transcriptional regulator [Vibrio aerogenes]SHI64331.1 HTH-type transcriptional regulator AcrR [Vibrio aerogenes CECT 7868]